MDFSILDFFLLVFFVCSFFFPVGEEDVENRPYMEICESRAGICIKGSFCGR